VTSAHGRRLDLAEKRAARRERLEEAFQSALAEFSRAVDAGDTNAALAALELASRAADPLVPDMEEEEALNVLRGIGLTRSEIAAVAEP
jgi:hypothetical protein